MGLFVLIFGTAMTKKLIIIGNGLGMALDPDHFSLMKAMTRVWESGTLSTKEKELIGALEGIETETGPTSEEELISTQIALTLLSDFRSRLGKEALDTWFTADAKDFPNTLRKYIFEVAHELYSYEISAEKAKQWQAFTQNLISFIVTTLSHVATLNYDDLLYEKIVNGVEMPDGTLLRPSSRQSESGPPYTKDGFISGVFNPDCFDWNGECGSYLHLHGTPLFVTKNRVPQKLQRHSLDYSQDTRRRHIVLANPKDKREIIDQSVILKNFWDVQLPRCIKEADEIIVFGYSGLDEHLNELLRDEETTPKWVIEWSGSRHFSSSDEFNDEEEIEPTQFWNSALGDNVSLIRPDDVLEFTDWENPSDFIPF
ncbi:hypothetical protein [Celeribacter litoreus]|uniref:hypothetical protein n=1 Tax=Celeribacter litoreus TaxID=2876714 RepID=UPI001CC98051|nr:hypothetical protein [Celeribacter litoreus]MCA0044730.1 hypothetical protein [Celeribacter litoreus]